MMSRVSLQRCDRYEPALLKDAIARAVSGCGFDMAALKGARVVLKPNLLMPFSPDRAVTTHPEFFRAAAALVREYTRDLVLVESPNFFPLVSTMKKAGLFDVAADQGIRIADNTATRTLHYPGARRFRNIDISRDFFDADVIINMPKLKSHGFTHFTGAVKNLFGAIPGTRKSRMHMTVPDPAEFGEYLLDLYGAFLHGFERPKKMLHLMDAVVGMEGEGPGPSGSPREIGAVLACTDAVALDYAAVRLVGLDVEKVFTVTRGFLRGYGASSPDEVEISGESLESMKVRGFVPSKVTVMGGVFWPLTSPTVKNLLVERPVPVQGECTLCLHCRTACPAGAITRKEGATVPEFSSRKCIRCFCCMETCPSSAIVLKKGTLQRFLGRRPAGVS